ncbi:MAG: hypothetical protein ACYCSS_15340, partial [Sulfuriferula sp.]
MWAHDDQHGQGASDPAQDPDRQKEAHLSGRRYTFIEAALPNICPFSIPKARPCAGLLMPAPAS